MYRGIRDNLKTNGKAVWSLNYQHREEVTHDFSFYMTYVTGPIEKNSLYESLQRQRYIVY